MNPRTLVLNAAIQAVNADKACADALERRERDIGPPMPTVEDYSPRNRKEKRREAALQRRRRSR